MPTYDVVIVGARAAGAATALLLARAGHRVVVVDRDRYGTDTLSTHALMRGGVVQLERWGLLDDIVAAGTPGVHRVTFDYGPTTPPVAVDVDRPLYAPRRTVLDRVLVDAARAAGAEVRFGCHVTDVLADADGVGGVVVRDRQGAVDRIDAALTIGADGRRSTVARAVAAPTVRAGTAATAAIYGHLEGVGDDGYEWFYGPTASAGIIPTNDGRACVFAGAASARFHAELRHDLPGAFDLLLRELSPALADRVAGARLDGPLRGFAGLPGWIRRPFGNGWALVGDAGYFKDPATAHGITDALRDAELLARAADEGLRGVLPMDAALAGYERVRNDLSWTLFEVTDAIARPGWAPDELQALHLRLSSAMQVETRYLAGLDPLRSRVPAAV